MVTVVTSQKGLVPTAKFLFKRSILIVHEDEGMNQSDEEIQALSFLNKLH